MTVIEPDDDSPASLEGVAAQLLRGHRTPNRIALSTAYSTLALSVRVGQLIDLVLNTPDMDTAARRNRASQSGLKLGDRVINVGPTPPAKIDIDDYAVGIVVRIARVIGLVVVRLEGPGPAAYADWPIYEVRSITQENKKP